MIGYKFLKAGLKSDYDDSPWELGEWRTVAPPEVECVGLNCSRLIPDTLGYVRGEILAKVEYGGKVIESTDKITCEKMRVIKAWKWTKTESVKLAVYAARLVLPIYEKNYPDDKRPRFAVESAEQWLNNPTKKNAADATYVAADSASAAAYAAAYVAVSTNFATNYAAADAAYAAASAASAADVVDVADAAYAAASAMASATDAATSATRAETKKKIHKYTLSLIPGMTEIIKGER